jgi:mannose-6-phosphate isomerase-like protein (cupin superfamily)
MADTGVTPARKPARAKNAAPRAPQKFSYQKPEQQESGKAIVSLCQTDIIRGAVQVVKEGGDNNLHSHTGMDGFWMVLKGAVRFYGPGDEVLGEFGPHEGIVMPRGAEYWFESCGDVDLELLQVVAFDRDVKNERVDVNDRKFDVDATERFDGRIRD